jgi:hypothetical protein
MLADVVEAAGRERFRQRPAASSDRVPPSLVYPGDVLVEHNDGANPSGSAQSSSTASCSRWIEGSVQEGDGIGGGLPVGNRLANCDDEFVECRENRL